ncbi:MAG: glycosyltransferase [Candidatus Marinimicrobia bacterium]|jgi:hypothetical protein|nr:glycosyltransferase [Candidatus Neomarinimicrobiota bacterium]
MNNVLLAIPTHGGIHESLDAWKSHVAAKMPNVRDVNSTGRPVDFNRNSLIRLFLSRKEFDYLLLIDSDIEPPLDCIERLLALDCPLASGCYPVWMHRGLRWALMNKDSDRRYRLLERLPSLTEPFEVDAGGAGCLLIRRDVFEKVKWPWFKWIEFEDGTQESEDVHFFRKCNEAGLRVKVDPKIICNHFKIMNLVDLMRMAAQLRLQAPKKQGV